MDTATASEHLTRMSQPYERLLGTGGQKGTLETIIEKLRHAENHYQSSSPDTALFFGQTAKNLEMQARTLRDTHGIFDALTHGKSFDLSDGVKRVNVVSNGQFTIDFGGKATAGRTLTHTAGIQGIIDFLRTKITPFSRPQFTETGPKPANYHSELQQLHGDLTAIYKDMADYKVIANSSVGGTPLRYTNHSFPSLQETEQLARNHTHSPASQPHTSSQPHAPSASGSNPHVSPTPHEEASFLKKFFRHEHGGARWGRAVGAAITGAAVIGGIGYLWHQRRQNKNRATAIPWTERVTAQGTPLER